MPNDHDALFPPKPEGEEPEETDATPTEEAAEASGEEAEPEGEETSTQSEPEAEASPSGEHSGGASIHRIREEEDFPALVQRVFTERGSKATGESYAGHLRRFITWAIATKGLDLKTMPPDTAEKYLEEAYPNPVTRAQANVALRSCFDVGTQYGAQIAKQEVAKPIRPRKPAKDSALGRLARGEVPEDAPAPQRRFGEGGPPRLPDSMFPPGYREQHRDAQAAQPSPTAHVSQPAETQRVSQPRATPGVPKNRTAVPPLGNRIRISKRSDGTDGFPPGTIILVGVYNGQDLEGEGSIEEFLANRVRPIYGPKAGAGIPTTYYVDRLDNLGNPIPNSTISVPIMPPLLDPAAQAALGAHTIPAPQAIPQPQPVAQGGPTLDTFVQYLMNRQEKAEKKYEELLAQMQSQAKQGGMDPMMFTLLAERMRPEPLDLAKAADEWKRANPDQQVKWGRRKTDREQPDDLFGRQSAPGGLGGLALGEIERERHERDSVLAETIRQQGEILKSILDRQAQPQPGQNPRDLFEMFATFARAIQPTQQPDALRDKLAEMAITQAMKPSEPGKSLKDLVAELRELRDASDILGGGEQKPLGVGDIVMAAVEHAPAIGEAIGSILSSMPRAPVLPKPIPVPVPGRRNGHAAAATKPAPMPAEAQAAFVALQTEVEEQQIANRLFEILMSYKSVNAEPWPRAADLIVRDYLRATTRDEIRTVTTNLYTWSGAKKLMTPQVIDRVTDVLTNHYSIIYAQLTGGQQKSIAAAPQPVAPTDTTPPRPEVLDHRPRQPQAQAAEPAGEEPTYEDEGGPTMTLPVGGFGNPAGAGQPPGLFGQQ